MNSDELKSIFVLDPTKAIEKSQQMICSISKFNSFQEFTSYHLKNIHSLYCPKPFSPKLIPQLSIYCIDCAVNNDDSSIMCLSCFLNGNHEGHNYFIFPGFMGSCQCGDKVHLNPSGFCSKHKGCEDDNNLDNYLDEELRSVLTNTIFKSSFTALLSFKENTEKAKKISDFIISFFQLGDGFRRLFIRSIMQDDIFNKSISSIQEYPNTVQTSILDLFSYLMHDQLFVKNFSKTVISLITNKINKNTVSDMSIVPSLLPPNYNSLFQFIFTCFSSQICRYNIEENGWDWISFMIEILANYKKLLPLFKKYKYMNYPQVFSIIKFIRFCTSIQPTEKTQEFFDRIFTQVFNSPEGENESIIVESYKKFAFSGQIESYLDFLSLFEFLMISFKSKPELKLDKLIEELDKSIDITPIFFISKNFVGDESGKNNENDRLISRFIIKKEETKSKSFFDKFKSTMKNIFDSYPSKYYQSIYNGGSFFISHPLYDSFSMLFRVDDLCRIKLARFLSQEKYQPLRIKLGIVTLKKLLSFHLFRLELFRIRNISLLFLYAKICEDKKDVKYNMIPLSVLQLLIGLRCNNENDDNEFIIKEFFSFELAREVGLFEDKLPKLKEKMTFVFLYLSLMIVIDRNMFNYEYKKVLEEQIIFSLKKGVHSIEKLNEICKTDMDDKSREYFLTFNEILMKVARKSTKDDDINDNNNENIEETNIKLHDFANMKPSDDDDDDDNDNDNDLRNNVNVNSFKPTKNEKDHKKENQNSYIKPVNFYLKDGIECNAISAVNPIDDQRSYLNIEISKNPNKLLKIQEFESEETYFFNSSTNDNNNDGLKIRLKQFLFTPTALAVVYDTLRSGSELNGQLSMNILILISKFIKEENYKFKPVKFNEQTRIQYSSLPELISKIKRIVFHYRVSGKDENQKGFIENTMNLVSFNLLLKMKIEPKNLPSKSIIEILMEKGELGQEVLHQISSNIHLDDLDSLDKKESKMKTKEEDLKIRQKQKAAKLKEDIMNQYSNIRNRFSDAIGDSGTLSSSGIFSTNKEVCSLCSESKNNVILCYPLYIYRTKFPFIVDKPPLIDTTDSNEISVYDNEEDFDKDTDLVEFLGNELKIQGDNSEEEMFKLARFKKIITSIFDQRQKEKEDLKISDEKLKRVTVGANFVVQYGICPHPVHETCVTDENNFVCPIDRSMKNGFLPSLEEIPMQVIFQDTKTFELKNDPLSLNIIHSISMFVTKFRSFFDCLKDDSINVFIELIKSLSGLIETYEIRVRNLPDSLDSTKTKILARNLFLTVWYAYRIQKKPKLTVISKSDSKEIDTDSRLTDFQRFVKLLIQSDSLADFQNRNELIREMVNSIVSSMKSSVEKNLKRTEKEICLFLRRVCLAEYFLLDEDVNNEEQELLDWDDVLTTENLAKRYNVKFTSIDLSNYEEFEFKPFVFERFPKEFLRLYESPYNLPITDVFNISMFNILDYNYLIKYYDDFDDTNESDEKTDNKNSNDNDNNNNDSVNDNDDNNNDNDNNNSNDNDNNSNDNDNNNSNDNDNSNNNDNENVVVDVDDDVKRYRRAVQVCDDEFLPFFMTFYGKLHYPSILMFTGALSSQIFLVDQSNGAALETFYVDKSGCPDINHARMQPLFLNEERYEKLIDQILSGDFSYNLTPMQKKKNLFNQESNS